jgi:hypothetical protein
VAPGSRNLIESLTFEMLARTKALLTLVFLAPILTEVVSGNTPAHALLDPRVTLFLLVAYGLPLLVVRELQLRWQLSNFGVFLLGLAYGIWNEGLLAQTLIRAEYSDRQVRPLHLRRRT